MFVKYFDVKFMVWDVRKTFQTEISPQMAGDISTLSPSDWERSGSRQEDSTRLLL